MGRKVKTGFKAQVNIKLHQADIDFLKRAFSSFCEKFGFFDAKGYKRSFNGYLRDALLEKAIQEFKEKRDEPTDL